MPPHFSRQLASSAVRLALLAGLSACALPQRFGGPSTATVDPKSPVAKDVLNASRHPGPYPRFSDIPEVPTDIRPASEWRVAVTDLTRRKAVLDADAAALPPALTDTEAYAAQHRSKVGAQPGEVAPPDAEQQTKAYAQSLRERATPPPSPK